MYFSSFGRIPALAFLCLWVGLESTSLVEAQDAAATEAPTSAPTEENWTGCIDPNDPGALVTIGDPTPICLIVSDGTDWSEDRQYFRLLFQPKADEYSRFRVPNSFAELVSDNRPVFASDQIAVHVQSQKNFVLSETVFPERKHCRQQLHLLKGLPLLDRHHQCEGWKGRRNRLG